MTTRDSAIEKAARDVAHYLAALALPSTVTGPSERERALVREAYAAGEFNASRDPAQARPTYESIAAEVDRIHPRHVPSESLREWVVDFGVCCINAAENTASVRAGQSSADEKFVLASAVLARVGPPPADMSEALAERVKWQSRAEAQVCLRADAEAERDAATKRADEAEIQRNKLSRALAMHKATHERRMPVPESDALRSERDAALSALATAEATMRERCAVVCDEDGAGWDAGDMVRGALETAAARIRSLPTATGEKS